jgi:hypothetical protein
VIRKFASQAGILGRLDQEAGRGCATPPKAIVSLAQPTQQGKHRVVTVRPRADKEGYCPPTSPLLLDETMAIFPILGREALPPPGSSIIPHIACTESHRLQRLSHVPKDPGSFQLLALPSLVMASCSCWEQGDCSKARLMLCISVSQGRRDGMSCTPTGGRQLSWKPWPFSHLHIQDWVIHSFLNTVL